MFLQSAVHVGGYDATKDLQYMAVYHPDDFEVGFEALKSLVKCPVLWKIYFTDAFSLHPINGKTYIILPFA